MKRIFVTVIFLFAIQDVAFGQIDFTKQYFNGKSFFREGKYNLAMESFKPLIPYDKNNQFSEYAKFYYALAAYRQGYRAVAKDMFNQIKSVHPTWDKTDEVNFWLGKIHLENGDYFQGLKLFNAIGDRKFEKDIEAAKAEHLVNVSDVETLKMMLEEYPKDHELVKLLAKALSKNLTDTEIKNQLEDLIRKHQLKRSDFIPEAPKTFFKEKYAVSVMLPFMVNTLEPTPARKRNQIILDFYEGMKLAADTLNSQSVTIDLRAYDTERSTEKIKKLLVAEELKTADLIVGPLFNDENRVIQDFSLENKINVFNPFSNNSEVTGINPYAFLFQPSSETMGKKSAEFLADHIANKNCMVIYGAAKKDSVLMANFSQKALEKGLKIVSAMKVSAREAGKITQILATPTEYDEFKYPSQFTLRKDSIDGILVASDDALIYSKVVSSVETRADSIMVIGSENWLDDTAIDLEKYQSLGIVLAAPNFVSVSDKHYQTFQKKFIRIHGRTPSNMARMGYEFMMFAGHQLKTNGVYFQEGLNNAGQSPGFIGQGYNYQFSHDNQLVPFIKFEKGEPIVVQKR